MDAIDVATLFREHATFVASMVRRIGGIPEHEVDDVVQEVFVIAHERGGYVPGPARPRTWLSGIVLRVVANRRRWWQRRRSAADEDAVARAISPAGTPFDVVATTEALVSVQRALDTLDLQHRAVFVLFELAGEPCDQIAAALEVPIGTVYSRLSAARTAFQKAFRRNAVTALARARWKEETHGP